MKYSISLAWQRKFLLVSILFLVMGMPILTLKSIQSTSAASWSSLQIETPYPTNYPPDKQTLEAEERLTQEAAMLTPLPAGTDRSFLPSTPTPDPWELTPYPATPAGEGEIIDNLPMQSLSKLLNININNKWYAEIGDRHYNVFAGSDYYDPTHEQGMVYVVIFMVDGSELPDGGYYLTTIRSGALQIVDAVGSRLILQSTDGDTFYFDVPGQQFTDSLTENVPTVTPWRPITPYPTNTPAFTDDAPNRPIDIPELSPINTTLNFTISSDVDVDWFQFFLPVPGTVQVQITNLPADYDLYVSGVGFQYNGQSAQTGTTDEIVTIPNAIDSYYVVRVSGSNGTFDPANPYQLRFGILTSPTACDATIQPGLR